MSPFQAHGIKHLSPSSINAFANSPALWVMERLLDRKVPGGAKMNRGTAVEKGIVAGLYNPDLSEADCIEIAQAEFRQLSIMSSDAGKDKEIKDIPAYVRAGIKLLRPLGIPTTNQEGVEIAMDGVSVPVIGYIDLYYKEHGIVDIKTKGRMPSNIDTKDARQLAFYQVATSDNYQVRACYLTPIKASLCSVENPRAHYNALRNIALSLQRFLAISDDPKVLAGLVAPDVDSFYFNSPILRQHAFEVYGV